MPIYEYVCEKCGKLNEVIQKVTDPAPEKCDGCGTAGKLTRIVSRTSFQLKGGGWYSDLYSSTKKGGGSGESAKPATPAKTESSSSASGSSSSSSSSSGSSGGSSGGSSSGGSSTPSTGSK
ncbi:MAG: FmdB family zinc ribbon protein [Myxococcaceae bacterium]